MKLVLPYPPTLNHLKAIVRGRMVTTKTAREFMAIVAAMARAQGAKPIQGEVAVTVRAYRPRRAGDLDNTLKAAFDSLKGIAWNDDSQVIRIHAWRFDDKANPRLELEVEPAEAQSEAK
jgi:Holliday junction resolvase RusA-like endonuclease